MTEYVRDLPPAYLLGPCPVQDSPVSTNGELLTRLDDLYQAIRSCNDDKAALREWASKE